MTANEGEPNDTYSIDPDGSVSIIAVNANYAVTTLSFESFNQLSTLKTKGFRIASPTNTLILNQNTLRYLQILKRLG
jgi:hypothetical protein